MAKSNETNESFLFHIAMKESGKKCSFAVNSALLANLDRRKRVSEYLGGRTWTYRGFIICDRKGMDGGWGATCRLCSRFLLPSELC